MKITRQNNQNEKSKITAPWLYEFAYDLAKNSYNNVDYLKDYFNSRKPNKGFNTIDEKMADIKDRVGFDLARKISEEVSKNNIIAAESCKCQNSCSCTIKKAEYQHPEEDVRLMGNILNYIQDMIKHEPHLDRATIISQCRDEEGLGFNRLRINQEKLNNFIDDQLKIQNDKRKSNLVSYIPNDPFGDSDSQNWEAEYYRHSKPGG